MANVRTAPVKAAPAKAAPPPPPAPAAPAKKAGNPWAVSVSTTPAAPAKAAPAAPAANLKKAQAIPPVAAPPPAKAAPQQTSIPNADFLALMQRIDGLEKLVAAQAKTAAENAAKAAKAAARGPILPLDVLTGTPIGDLAEDDWRHAWIGVSLAVHPANIDEQTGDIEGETDMRVSIPVVFFMPSSLTPEGAVARAKGLLCAGVLDENGAIDVRIAPAMNEAAIQLLRAD